MVALLLALSAVPAAQAAPWQRVTTPDGDSTDQVAHLRTRDGALHLAWSHPTGPNTEDLDRKGRVTLTIRSHRAVTVKASRDAYTGAKRKLKVRGG